MITIPLIILTTLAAPALPDAGSNEGGGRPNVVLIVLDAARADHFSGYGYGKETTPELDRIAGRGATFLNNFSPATKTFSSLPLIFSSRYFSRPVFQKDSWDWGVRREHPSTIFQDYDSEQILLPELLNRNGYRTAIFHNHWWLVEETDLIKAHDEAHIFPSSRKEPVDGRIIDSVIEWLGGDHGKLFYLYCHIMSPHQPYPPKAEDKDFLGEADPAELQKIRDKFFGKNDATTRNWNPRELEYLEVLYNSNLKHSDSQVGRLYGRLRELGLDKNTLFIVTSDHGENLGEHGILNHDGPSWDSCVRVPLIMVYPPRIPAGTRISGQTECIDIMPTIVDLCQLEVPPGKKMDGTSLTGLLNGTGRGKEYVYPQNAVRSSGHKLILPGELLFNLDEDPKETTDTAGDNPKLVARLKKQYDDFMEPYLQRFRNAVRRSMPDFPFFYPLRAFSFSPSSVVQRVAIGKRPEKLLKEVTPQKPWLLNTDMHLGGLFCLPGEESPPPLTLSASLPNGVYGIHTLVRFIPGLSLPRAKDMIFARFDRDRPFKSPVRAELVRRADNCIYLEWGQAEIDDENFQMEIRCAEGSTASFFLEHVKFQPIVGAEEKKFTVPEDSQIRQRRDQLKSLGYL